MSKKIISVSYKTKHGILDDNYTLFDDGTVLHEFDRNSYPNGQNLSETLSVSNISKEIKVRLVESATTENLDVVLKVLSI